MTDKKIKIGTGILSLLLLVSLIIKLCYVPGGMILSGLFLGSMVIVCILVGCLIAARLLRFIFKNNSFLTLYFVTTAICFLIFHYQLYSPSLKIIVPKGFTGKVTLVLSNVRDNILTVDTNGIGYLNEWTFNKTYAEPTVLEADGNKINQRCVSFGMSTFWGLGTFCCVDGKVFKTLSFEIVSSNKTEEKLYYDGERQYKDKDVTGLVDRKLVMLFEPDEHSAFRVKQ